MTQFSDGRLNQHEATRLSRGRQNPPIQDDLREVLDWLDAKAPTQAHRAERERLRAWVGPAIVTALPASVETRSALVDVPAVESELVAVPDGWQLVPIDPTKEMMAEINLTGTFAERAMKARYHAMLAAAPLPTPLLSTRKGSAGDGAATGKNGGGE